MAPICAVRCVGAYLLWLLTHRTGASKASHMGSTARSELGANMAYGRQAQGENLMASIRAQKSAAAEQQEGSTSSPSRDQVSAAAAGGWAMHQQVRCTHACL